MALFVLALSCETQEPIALTPGTIKFRWTEKQTSGGRVNGQHDPKSILISINDAQGATVHQLKKLTLYKFGQEYLSESLQLLVGSYQLVEFFVLDEDDNIIYATPVEGSELANLVDHPLPVEFEITESGNTELIPQVLPVNDGDDAESFGYATFGFEVIAALSQSQIKEVWINEPTGTESFKYFLNYSGNQLKSVAIFGLYGNDTEWTAIDSITFKYNSEGKLSEKMIHSFTLPPHYTTEKYTTYTYQYGTGGELTSMTRSGGLMTNIEVAYNYDALGHISTAVEHSSFQTFEYEFEVNSVGDVLKQKRFFVGGLGRKLQYSLEFTYDQSLKNGSLNAVDLLSFDIFRHGVSFGIHNIASHQTAIYSDSNGIVSEISSCLNTAQYELNSSNQLKKVSYFDPNLCMNKVFDEGTKLIFIY